MKKEYKSYSLEDTLNIACNIAKNAKKGDIFGLRGEMGAGKTAFAKGFAQGLNIKSYVNSPTFTLMQIYENGTLPLYHFDLYRLGENLTEDSLDDLGFWDYLDGDGICLIEWAEYAKNLLPSDIYWVDIEIIGDYRRIIYDRDI